MGYWLIKREIREIALLLTLRNQKGDILHREHWSINTSKAFTIEIGELLKKTGLNPALDFYGSIELEVFSTQNLVFPYPAFVLTYYGEGFTTAVHTAGRIYNDIEDLQENEETAVPESGFDIYDAEDLQPFIAFTNGPFAEPKPEMKYTVIAEDGRTFDGCFRLRDLAPYETVFLFLKDEIDLASMLRGRPGTIKLKHAFRGFFPRWVAGNFQTSYQAASITHTYYDCSKADKPSDYWQKANDRFNDSSIFVPLYTDGDWYTDVVFYPIYSPSLVSLGLAFYDENGGLVKELPGFRTIAARSGHFEKLRFKEIMKTEGIDAGKAKGVRLVLNAVEGQKFPSRIKMGLNIGREKAPVKIPCNICFNAQPGDAAVEKKDHAFRWTPFLNGGDSALVLTNASPLKHYDRTADVELTFYREADGQTLARKFSMPPFSHKRIHAGHDPELQAFFGGKSGWVTAKSSNPFLFGWYFDFHETGSVAGDHCF